MTRRFVLGWLLVLVAATTARAQQRPLTTQDPETIGAGHVLVEAGFDYGLDVFYPVSGLTGNLLRLPLVGVVFGLGSVAEVQLTGGLHDRLSITNRNPSAPLAGMLTVTGDTTSDVDDIVFATKVRLLAENASRPAIGLRFATRLPNASNESGLGTDTMDFYAVALAAKTVRSIRVVGNLGLGILSDPTRGDRQNDVLMFSVSVARALTTDVEVVGEINGRLNTRTAALPGTESRSVIRGGIRYTRGAVRFDAAGLLGMTDRDPSLGIGAGVTYIFNAFKQP